MTKKILNIVVNPIVTIIIFFQNFMYYTCGIYFIFILDKVTGFYMYLVS